MALPTSLSGLVKGPRISSDSSQWHGGPFISSAGNVYVFGPADLDRSLIAALKATDPTASFSEVNSANRPDLTNDIWAISSYQVSDVIHLVTLEDSTGRVAYHTFNMATDAWGTKNEQIAAAGSKDATTAIVDIAVRSDGDVVVIYGATAHTSSMSSFGRVCYARREGGSWTSGISLDDAGTGSVSWVAGCVVLGSSDRMHFGLFDRTNSDVYVRTLLSDNTLQAMPSAADATASTDSNTVHIGHGTSYVSSGTTKVRIPYVDSTGYVAIVKFDSADSPSFSTETASNTSAVETGGTEVAAVALTAAGTTLYALWRDITTDDILRNSNENDAGWSGSNTTTHTGTATNFFANVIIRGGNYKLAWVVNENGGTEQYDEVDLGAASSNVSRAPAAGALSLTGRTPTLARAMVGVAGALAIAGAAPTVAVQMPVPAGALSVTGAAPTAYVQHGAAPARGALSLTGAAPTVLETAPAITITPPAGGLAFTGAAPTLTLDYRVAPAAGAVSVAGAAPTARVVHTAAPGAGALSVTGAAPSATQTVLLSPGAGALSLTGATPAAVQTHAAAPSAGALSLTGAAPAARVVHTATPAAGALALTGAAPSIVQAHIVTPGAGALSVTGAAPAAVQAHRATPAAGALALTGAAPSAVIPSALAFDAFSGPASGGSGLSGDQSWTHTPNGTPRGVLVFVAFGINGDMVNGVTYGGVSLTEVALSPLSKATGETAQVHAFFLGAGIPSGAQTVSIDTTGTADLYGSGCITLTAANDLEVIDTTSISSDSLENPSGTLSLGGRTGFCALGFTSGNGATSSNTPLTGWTSRNEDGLGSTSTGIYTYDTIGTADVTFGYTALANDVTCLGVAIGEQQAQVVLPGAGALSLTGRTPTLAHASLPSAGALSLTGAAPAAVVAQTVAPGAGALSLTGAAPAASVAHVAAPSAGALSVTGAVPTATQAHITTPSVGALNLSGGTPSLAQTVQVAPSAGALSVTGAAPSAYVQHVAGPSSGAMSLTGAAPSVTQTQGIAVPAGALSVTGTTPVARVVHTAAPAAGALSLTGAAPARLETVTVAPAAGVVSLTGAAPTLTLAIAVAPQTGALSLTGAMPAALVAHTTTPSAGALTLSSEAPAARITQLLTPSAGALSLSGAAPVVVLAERVAPAAGALSLSGGTPRVVQALAVAPSAGALSLTGAAPTLTLAAIAQPAAGALSLTGVAPTVLSALAPQPAAGAVAVTGAVPSLSLGYAVAPSAGALSLSGATPTLTLAIVAAPGTGALGIGSTAPTVTRAVETEVLAVDGTYRPTLAVVGTYQPSVSLTGTYTPTLALVGTERATLALDGIYRPTLSLVGDFTGV